MTLAELRQLGATLKVAGYGRQRREALTATLLRRLGRSKVL
jgi:hypothetical protein